MKTLIFSEAARAFLKENGIQALTIDVENFGGGCVVVSEAVIREEAPKTPEGYERHTVDQTAVYVFAPLDFVANTVNVDLRKGLIGKARLEAKTLKPI